MASIPTAARGSYASIRRYCFNLPDHALVPNYCGIRVNQDAKTHGVPWLINLFGIVFPELTSSLAIAEFVVFSA